MTYLWHHRNDTGFTLIELLLYISILGTLLLAITAFLGVSVDTRIKAQSISEVDQQGTETMEKITHAIRNASSITSPAIAGSGSSLTVASSTASLNPTIFSVNSGILNIKEGAGSTLALTNSKVQISSPTFTNLSRPGTKSIIRISFTISHINNSGRNEYSYKKTFVTSVGLRQ